MTVRERLAQLGGALALLAALVLAVFVVSWLVPEAPAPPRAERPPVPEPPRPPPPEVPPLPPVWGEFAGAPPDFVVPPGGSVEVRAGAVADRVLLRRADRRPFATALVDDAGRYLEARYFDARGRARVVVSAARAVGPAGTGGPRGRVRCGAKSRANAGWRWRRFPLDWRLDTRGVPRPGTRRVLRAIRRARATWNANKTHCRGIRDRSRARFRFRGGIRRRLALDGRSVVEFSEVNRLGGVCVGTVACTITWISAGAAVESDTRLDRNVSGGYADGRRRGRLDVETVMTHESGHTLGFGHVGTSSNVMFPFVRRNDVSGRRLGRGDALGNNAKY